MFLKDHGGGSKHQMTGAAVECVWPVEAELGEGPVWIGRDSALMFVDIKGRRIHRLEELTGERRSWTAPEPIGFLAPVEGGGFIAGLKSGLYRFDPGAGRFARHLCGFESVELGNRLNDGFVDPSGRLWFGSMHDAEVEESGFLYRLEEGPSVRRCDGGYKVTNGPAMSPGGKTLYHVDTVGRRIWAFDVASDASLSNRRLFLQVERPDAYPDGLAVDAEGCLWVALFGGWGVERYDPAGRLIDRIEAPCANVTKAAFGGPELKTLYFTTARVGLSDRERAEQPLAGGLFRVPAEVAGLAQNCVSQGL